MTRALEPGLRIATFVNDERVYQGLLDSFAAAGFDPPYVTYERLSDAREDPYAAIRRLGRMEEPYVLLLHQDVRCDHGHRLEDLLAALEDLNTHHPAWALAGNAGGTGDLRLIKHVSDPWGTSWSTGLPHEVTTLDEDLLVLRTAASPTTSPSLSGFHHYGTDACLNARVGGARCFVIDFRVTHLSGGNREGYEESAAAIARVWAPRSLFAYLRTSNSVIFLSRVRALRRVFGSSRLRTRLEFERWPRGLYARTYRGWLR